MPNEITALLATIKRLRAPDGCPWDRAQTHESLIPYLEEESAEVIEAILEKDSAHLKEELGDLLLQILLHAQIASETEQFDFNAIARTINEKMIRRHPHVFSDTQYESVDAQKAGWEKIKESERKTKDRSLLDSIPSTLSGLTTAVKLQKKAAKVGFDWNDVTLVLQKVDEELHEFKEELTLNNHERLEEELGDILFALGNVARHLQLDPERALARTNLKFRSRFNYIEQNIGKPLSEATLAEMDQLWTDAKSMAK